MPGSSVRDLVFVATEHDSVYAFDARTLAPVWHDSFINPAAGLTTVSSTDLNAFAVTPEYGITGTPVIDPATSTLYVVAKMKYAPAGAKPVYVQQLAAIDLATGALKFGGPVNIQATAPGRGVGSVGGWIAFDPKMEFQRPALLLSSGVVYVGFASHDDQNPWHAWLLGYDARTLRQAAVLNLTPNGTQGSIWMSGGGPAADAAGVIYLATGNGTFSPALGNYGDSVVKLVAGPGGLRVADYFAPYNQAQLNFLDLDLGSGGVLLLPDQAGPRPRLLVIAGKEGKLYLLDRDNLGHYNGRSDLIVQSIPHAMVRSFDTPAYFNGTIYYVGAGPITGEVQPGGERMKAYTISGGLINPTPRVAPAPYGYPGSTPSVSAFGSTNGIVWTLDNGGWFLGQPAVLRASDATDITRVLYESTQAPGGRDRGGPAVKFTVPTVANGRVYVGGAGTLTVYGLLSQK
jgi:hypothetical protein